MTMTYGDVLGQHGVLIPDHLEAQAEIPVISGLQAQGDVMVVPTRPSAKRGELVPAEGVTLITGDGGHTHSVVGEGLRWAPSRAGGQDLGVLTVPAAGVAYLIHDGTHGAMGLAPGDYVIRRQREQADEIRLVAD